jgi:hypothetical protein
MAALGVDAAHDSSPDAAAEKTQRGHSHGVTFLGSGHAADGARVGGSSGAAARARWCGCLGQPGPRGAVLASAHIAGQALEETAETVQVGVGEAFPESVSSTT